MKRVLLPVFAMILGAVLLLGRASAYGKGHENDGHENEGTVTAPEFDPATAGGVAAVLVGGGILIARRRRA